MTRLPIALAAVATMAGAASAATCTKSGIETPDKITMTVDPSQSDDVALIVDSKCGEKEVKATTGDNVGDYRIIANNMSVKAVESYPAVASIFLQDNVVASFKAVGTTLKELDLTNNHLTSLENIEFPSSVTKLILDFNPIKSFTAADLPPNVLKVFLRKAALGDVSTYSFPDTMQELYLTGNQNLVSLKGLLLPDSVQLIECNDSGVEEIVGVVFPKSLTNLVIRGKAVSSFIVRESDISILQKAKLDMSVTGLSCQGDAKLTTITDDVSACVMDDTSFAAAYPTKTVVSTPTTAPPVGSSSNGTATTPVPTQDTENGSGGGSSNTATIAVSVAVVVVVLVGAAIAWFCYRRRKNRRGSFDKDKNTGTDTKTHYTGMSNASSSVNNGFLHNDVRNDTELIPYRLPHDAVQIIAEIATGGFGIVYQATLYGQTVVVKQVLPTKANSPEILGRFMDEIRLYARLDHPKIVKFVGLSWTNLLDLSLVIEFMPRGDLHGALKANHRLSKGRGLFTWFDEQSEPRCKSLLAQDVVEALVYLHSFESPIIHRDLKAKNVLLSEDYEAKLSDFGISRESIEETMTGGMGTTAWIAPEVLQGERYSEKADIYSFGILMCELDLCGHPYDRNKANEELTDAKIAYLVSTEGLKPILADDCPPSIEHLIMSCLEFDPSNRPSALELHYNLRKIREASQQAGFV
ncbi:hypothetical protein Poli38472_001918 [Pythium oligandrum]|uniref:Protein kinase domain-containing protein n=1 Tax=Pythium oligandrum TaxID=41045 RepID=A0A8K1CVN4_PYTOL|nr:hypothetical protein Poli38472_001918 [Pythium oligandrum]|eukprot:TMW69762.1 hypothetical protein Poli38472_001918 [Pythium oligandrum]